MLSSESGPQQHQQGLNHPQRPMNLSIVQTASGVRFPIKVVPGASRDKVMGELGDALKIAVRKPPENGAANAAVVALLAKTLGIAEHSIRITRGHSNPRKEVEIDGLTPTDVL